MDSDTWKISQVYNFKIHASSKTIPELLIKFKWEKKSSASNQLIDTWTPKYNQKITT